MCAASSTLLVLCRCPAFQLSFSSCLKAPFGTVLGSDPAVNLFCPRPLLRQPGLSPSPQGHPHKGSPSLVLTLFQMTETQPVVLRFPASHQDACWPLSPEALGLCSLPLLFFTFPLSLDSSLNVPGCGFWNVLCTCEPMPSDHVKRYFI